MKVLIDIPEDEYQNILHTGKASFVAANAIEAGTPIPENATNGEVFGKIMDYIFMDDAYITTDKHGYLHLRGVKDDWWNSPYKEGGKKEYLGGELYEGEFENR